MVSGSAALLGRCKVVKTCRYLGRSAAWAGLPGRGEARWEGVGREEEVMGLGQGRGRDGMGMVVG